MRTNPWMSKEEEDEMERKVHTDLPGKRRTKAVKRGGPVRADRERFLSYWHNTKPYMRPCITIDEAWDIWQEARRWIPVTKEKIPLNEFVICGLWVHDRKNEYDYFDTYQLSFDDDFSARDKWGNYISEWEYDDFTSFIRLPPPPEEEQ